MRLESIKTFLETMCEYNTVNIVQTFTNDRGRSVSVKCLSGTNTFEITDLEKATVWHIDSSDEAAEFVLEYIDLQMFNV